MSGIENLVEKAQKISRWSQGLLTKAPLTDVQREDFIAIDGAAKQFVNYAISEIESITDDLPTSKKQQIRHQLRNYLNIIIGFSRLIVKDLPDNLLMDMVTIRKIHDTGEFLREHVDQIQ